MARMMLWLHNPMVRIARVLRALFNEQAILRREYERCKQDMAARTPGNPALHGYKAYSQFDEDGIIAHIFSVLGRGNGVFVEIGCSDGLENNTHALLLQGWRGAWIDADGRKIHSIVSQLPRNSRLAVKQEFVFAENALSVVRDALEVVGAATTDFLSVDIDGDDLGVLIAVVDVLAPRVICVEYNPKFPPPIKVAIKSRRGKFWSGDDYYGASLMSLVEALGTRGFRLIACGVSGVNAFFVREDDAVKFPAFAVEQLFQPAMHHLTRLTSGSAPSLKFLSDSLAEKSNLPPGQ